MAVRFVTTRTAANMLGCTQRHITLLIRQNKLRAKRVGPIWLVNEKSLAAYSYSSQRDIGRPAGSLDQQPRKQREPKPIPLPAVKAPSAGKTRVHRKVEV